ncbi:MAG: DUF58 domain-containing protein [Xanthomonadales bacterium]|nr:DUF58 domain-containing protein [Xanthomonadales bacterium]
MERFIDPRTLARVKDLPLIAKTVADGFLHGLQQSHQRGIGIEFSQYRAYEPGDPLSRIDWKLFARSDRYFVREAERESEIAIWFVLDASASMNLASETKPGGWSKFEYARHLLATLSYIGQQQGDHVGLLALSGDQHHLLPPASGERHWHRLLRQLSTIESGDSFPNPALIKSAIQRLQKTGLIFIISDFYQKSNELDEFITQVSAGRTEVVAMHLQTTDELQFPYKGAIRFEDLESGEQVLVSAAAARETWMESLAAHQQELERLLRRQRVSLNRINVDEPMDQALYDFLTSRQKIRH